MTKLTCLLHKAFLTLIAVVLIVNMPNPASADIGAGRAQIEQSYGPYCLVEDYTGLYWTHSQWQERRGALAKSYGYLFEAAGISSALWVEYDKNSIVKKEKIIMGSSFKIKDFGTYAPALHKELAAPSSFAVIIKALPKDHLGVIVRKTKTTYNLIHFIPADPEDKTPLNIHSEIRNFEIAPITLAEVKDHLNTDDPASRWYKTDNYFRPELYFSEKLVLRTNTDMIVIHHTNTESVPIAVLHAMHLKNGWAGIGYHKAILADGKIVDGRPENMIGAHALGVNPHSIGIAVVGNFETGLPSPAQMIALEKLTLELLHKYQIPLQNVLPHRAVTPGTLCPGRLFPWDDFIARLATALNKKPAND